ncbi:N-acetylglucosamine-1-phosphate uridyltransferase [Enhygromyxa salina]|uniref:N-acetylglucosamine-1-phosphate uridyltransferase n=1 Tax=Enhygromyxa salina TaxID=215803 RepID=A0A0C1ZPF7_9BACT|nr:NTP transferase domain-containing protein [Enhygromyxa salina]KIG12898.1 N-acetylglucosamine-1-phosphate uridyltransferase [Enhygromyxa salina]
MNTLAILLAAGKGTRMRSDLAKVLHPFAGEPLVLHPLRAAREFGVARSIVVVGHQGADVKALVQARLPASAGWAIGFAVQAEQNGTGHAVMCALPELEAGFDGAVLILSGDVPLLRAQTLQALADACRGSAAGISLASFRAADPTGYGRIVRDANHRCVAIREHKDASPAEREINECNAGVYCVRAEHLRRELPQLGADNAAGEIYLTDLIALRARAGAVAVVEVQADEVAGVNTPEQLIELEARGRARGWIS